MIYYLRADGTATDKALATSDTSPSTALNVREHNNTTFAPGDEIVLSDAGGVYTTRFILPSGGVKGNPITYRGKGLPLIDLGYSGADCFYAQDKDYVSVRALDFAGWLNHAVWAVSCAGFDIQDCTGENGGNDTAPSHGIRVTNNAGEANLPDVVVKNNTIGRLGTTQSNHATRTAIFVTGVAGAVISGNRVHPENTKGIVLARTADSNPNNTDCLIEENICTSGYGPNISWQDSDRTIVRYNTARDTVGGGIHPTWRSRDSHVYANIIENNSMVPASQSYNAIDINNVTPGGYLYANYIRKCPRHSFMIDGASPNWTVKYNILDASENDGTGVTDGRALAFANRDAAGCTGFVEDENIIVKHPEWDYYGSWGQGEGELYTLDEWRANTGQGINSVEIPANDFENAFVSWDYPTVRADGRALLESEISHVEVLIGDGVNFTHLAYVENPMVAYLIPDTAAGSVVRLVVVDTDGLSSDAADRPLDASPPGEPGAPSPPAGIVDIKIRIISNTP